MAVLIHEKVQSLPHNRVVCPAALCSDAQDNSVNQHSTAQHIGFVLLTTVAQCCSPMTHAVLQPHDTCSAAVSRHMQCCSPMTHVDFVVLTKRTLCCSPMTRVVKVLWTASRAQGKKTDRQQITGNDYTGTC